MESRVTCLSESTVVGLLERDLPSEQRAEIEAHLDACASCRRVVVDLTVLSGNAPGRVTVCVADAEPTSPAICQTIEIPRIPPEVREGRGIYPAIPMIVQR